MYGRDSVGEEILALGSAPLGSDAVDFFLVVSGCGDSFGKFFRNIQRKRLRQKSHLAGCRNRFQARNDRDIDTGFPAQVDETVENLVVEKHLCNNVIRARIDLALQIFNVRFNVGALEMLFRITADTYAE